MMISFSTAYGAGNDDQWEVVKKVSRGKNIYSVMLNHDTNELTFQKEEREKNEKKLIYQTTLGKWDDKTRAKISLKEDRIFIILSGESGLALLRLDEQTGEIGKQVDLSLPAKKQKKKVKSNKYGKKLQSELMEEEDKPEAPSFLTVQSLTSTSAEIMWNKVVGAKEYRIYIGDLENHDLIDQTSKTSYTIDNLVPDEIYGIYVTAVHDEGESEIEVATAVATPGGDGLKTLTVTSNQESIDLSWSPLEGVTGYKTNIWWIIGDGEYVDRYDSTTETNYSFKDLDPLNLYVMELTAMNGTYRKDSAIVAAMTYPPKPEPPDNLYYEIDSGILHLSWDKSKYATEYRIYNGTALLRSVGTNQNTFDIEGLEEGQTYDLYVLAKNIAGTSEKAHLEVNFVSDDDELGTPPDIDDPPAPTGDLLAPQGFEATKIKQTTVLLQWLPVVEAKGYILWINGKSSIPLENVTQFELKNLEPNTWYELHLRALDEEGKDGYSAVITIKTLPVPPDPPVVKIDKITSISAFLSWKKPPRATKYKIIYQGDDQDKVFKKPQVKIKGLEEEKKYTVYVVAANRGGDSEPTEVVIETIPLTFDYIYDGQLLETIESSYEKTWKYSYDSNGNTSKVVYTPEPKPEEQEFDIRLIKDDSDDK